MIKRKTGVSTPQANLAINKSRIKLYGKNSKAPTYYLKKGQEFEIELFNPTKDTIMAKISLNGKPIAQGGLVLKPGVRVFLDRYIDVARKFKFDTYEVGNSSEVKKAIEDNGDFKVEFFKELQQTMTYSGGGGGITIFNDGYNNGSGFSGSLNNTTTNVNYINRGVVGARGIAANNSTYTSNAGDYKGMDEMMSLQSIQCSASAEATLDMMDFAPEQEMLRDVVEPKKNLKSKRTRSAKKTIETGRVEEGSHSDQTMTKVYLQWESYPFHTLEYKMIPISQKINTLDDINVKRYCTSCGNKQKPNFKFCPSCGARV